MSRRFAPFVRRIVIACVIAAIAGAAIFVPFAGRFLAVDDGVTPADAVVVLDGTRAERWLEAADLYRAGTAPALVLSSGRREPAERQLERDGLHYPANAELARDMMVRMGIPAKAVTIVGGTLDNTAEEAAALRAMAAARGWRRLTIVTSKYHCRRARLAFRREFAGTGVEIFVHPSRYDPSDPPRWWRSRMDIRFVISELPKFVLYRAGLGT
jgi:uncharacterized SAM-binding protein YcdF (DUF218 family)